MSSRTDRIAESAGNGGERVFQLIECVHVEIVVDFGCQVCQLLGIHAC